MPRRFPETTLREFAETALAAVGAAPNAASVVAGTLLEADRYGISSHGLVRVPSYCAQARAGEVSPGAEPRIERSNGPTAVVDGGRGFGAVTGMFAVNEAVTRAEEHGIGFVAARGGNHFGAASCYSRRVADRGLVGVVATNTPAVMAPWGGAEARLGNNPLSVAAPMPGPAPPFVLDMALSAVSRGRIKLAELNGERIPDDWALGPDGSPTSDPASALAGVLLPFGGYKGSGLALAVEVLTACLAGGDLGADLVNSSLTGGPARTSGSVVGQTTSIYVALDPACFGGRRAFLERMGRLAAAIESTPLAPGFAEVVLPGSLEARAAEAAAHEGIALEETTVELLEAFARREGIGFP